MRLEWLPLALADFEKIIDFIAQDDPWAAIAQGDEIESQVTLLQDNHLMGRPGRVRGTRELVVVRTAYIVAYRIKGNHIQILRVLHGSQSWPNNL